MAKTAKDILKLIREHDIKMVDFKMVDINGVYRHVTIPATHFSEELLERVDGWTTPMFILFFVLSGAELDFSILKNPEVLLLGVVYIVIRSAGKYFGAFGSSAMCGCERETRNYLGITLLPQEGMALGMALTAQALPGDGPLIRSIILFAVLVYELVGPTMTKWALRRSGEIRPEGKTSARRRNSED